ncbi:hypothetical protein ZIOFF_067892 [Zingiber officinale]|uniref:HMG box domain-containing protein n=1 Tax=Zingiber officinale TaxID=94328 RepID=A0A8J5ERF5_ZINOF|nr:hypothetical protein ZIOFF_067892 [Zingiber officinale]
MKREKSKTNASRKLIPSEIPFHLLMLLVKKGPERAAKKPRKSKVGKDPNMPKRPQSAFFVFMLLAGGDKWKSLTEEEKAPYIAKAAKLKADYTKTMAAYNKGSEVLLCEVDEDYILRIGFIMELMINNAGKG